MPGEDRWKSLGEFIRTQRRLADMSLRQLSHIAKVSNPYLSQIERGIYKPSAEVMKAIADALQISAESLFTRVGLLDDRTADEVRAERKARARHQDVERSIRLDPRLSAEQKTALIRVYRSFLSRSGGEGEAPAAQPKQPARKTKQGT